MERIICITNNKDYILRKISENKVLYNIKFYNFKELKKLVFFDYDNRALEYIMDKYKVNLNIALVYIENMYFLKDINNEKVKFLINLKQELEENNLLIKNELFKNSLKDKKVIVYEELLNKEEKLIMDALEVNYRVINNPKDKYKPIVYKAYNMQEEVEFVLDYISELIDKGIDINKIKIIFNKDYNNIIKRYFLFYHIPLNIKSDNNYYSTIVAQEFLNNYDNYLIEENIVKLKEKYNDLNDLITIINKSVMVDNKRLRKSFIIEDLKKFKIKGNIYDKAVEQEEIDGTFIKDEYVFLLGFNNNNYPKVVKDEDYFSDLIKEKLGLDTTEIMNKLAKEKLKEKLTEIKNLIITYPESDKRGKCFPSLLIDELNLEVKEVTFKQEIKYSKENSSLKYAMLLDDLYKFNIISKELKIYQNSLDIPYRKYNHEFKKVSKELLYKALNNSLVLAYTSMERYNECAFKFYLSNVLKIDIYEESFKTIIGNIFHYILMLGIKKEINIKEAMMEYIKEKGYTLNAKEYFYLDNLSEELGKVINVLKKQEKNSKLNKYLFEEELYVYKDRDINISFKGLIDKVMYQVVDGKEVVVVVDYKTGMSNITLDNMEYGLNLQLPIYLYLLKNSKRFEDAIIGGFYIQKVLHNKANVSDKSLEKVLEDNLKLQGYSNSDPKIIALIDKDYQNSEVIKNLKYKKDGSLYSNAKVLSSKEMDLLTKEVDQKIEECIDNILKGEFRINPKVINDKNVSCTYCKFKDICFKNKNDEVRLGGVLS